MYQLNIIKKLKKDIKKSLLKISNFYKEEKGKKRQ